MKKFPAFLTAFIMTTVMILAMLGIGADVHLNTSPSSVQSNLVNNAAVTTYSTASLSQALQNTSGTPQQQLVTDSAQLNQAIQEINAANQQITSLQSQVNQANAQLSDASSTLQGYQNILNQLQQRGLISLGSNGSIALGGRTTN